MKRILGMIFIAAVLLLAVGCADKEGSGGGVDEAIKIGEVSVEVRHGSPYLVLKSEKMYSHGGYRMDVNVEYDDQAKEMIVTPLRVISPSEEQPTASGESPARTHVRIKHADYTIVVHSGEDVLKFKLEDDQLVSI